MRWETPITKAEIENFMMHYNSFIYSAKNYRALAKKNAEEQQAKESAAAATLKLQKYMERSYGKCITPAEKEYMSKVLTQTINDARSINHLYTRDWDSYPLPVLPRESKRAPLTPQTSSLQTRQRKSLTPSSGTSRSSRPPSPRSRSTGPPRAS